MEHLLVQSPCLFFVLQLLPDCSGVSNKLSLSQLGLVSGSSLSLRGRKAVFTCQAVFALPVDLTSFVTHFEWDMAKYPAKQPLVSVVDTLAKVRRVCLEPSDHLRWHTWSRVSIKVESKGMGWDSPGSGPGQVSSYMPCIGLGLRRDLCLLLSCPCHPENWL